MIINIVIALVLTGIGLLFLSGKGSNLIAGYNTLNPSEKKQVNEKAMLNFLGYMMFFFSFCLVLWAIGFHFNLIWIFYLGLILF